MQKNNSSKLHIQSGQLKILIIEADLTRDVETFSKMDPYVQADWTDHFTNEKKSYKTK